MGGARLSALQSRHLTSTTHPGTSASQASTRRQRQHFHGISADGGPAGRSVVACTLVLSQQSIVLEERRQRRRKPRHLLFIESGADQIIERVQRLMDE